MLLRRLGTLPTASKRVLWKAITRKYCFCAYDIKLFSGQDSTSTGLHLKRPNTDTTSAVCICVMFALNLLLSEDQYQRGDLSLISLRRRKLLHHMRVQTHTDKTQCTINISHCTLETACLSILLKKNKLLHLTFAGPNTHTHTHVHTLKTSHHNQRCSGCGKTAIVSKAHLSVTWLLKSSVILNKALVPVAKQKIECTLTYAANNDQFQH